MSTGCPCAHLVGEPWAEVNFQLCLGMGQWERLVLCFH